MLGKMHGNLAIVNTSQNKIFHKTHTHASNAVVIQNIKQIYLLNLFIYF